MTGQMMQEKVATQLALNNNAFILIVREKTDIRAVPNPALGVEAIQRIGELQLEIHFEKR